MNQIEIRYIDTTVDVKVQSFDVSDRQCFYQILGPGVFHVRESER